ncbi:MAG: NADH-quinone oxidoreductase subunit K [Comamonadaceae bacterium]|nr:NADH-quinone oxidoreductase subunit K [Comamonadaceae bacterium]
MIWAVGARGLAWPSPPGLYLLLSRDVLRCVVGAGAARRAASTCCCSPPGGWASAQPPVVAAGRPAAAATAANPLPQALVLTAIVIGFALLCFSLVLVLRAGPRRRQRRRAGAARRRAAGRATPASRRADPGDATRRGGADDCARRRPVLVPLATALAARAARRAGRALQRAISLAGVLALLAVRAGAAGGRSLRRRRGAAVGFGDWPLPFGIEFARRPPGRRAGAGHGADGRGRRCCSWRATPTPAPRTPLLHAAGARRCWPASAAPSSPPTCSTCTCGSR